MPMYNLIEYSDNYAKTTEVYGNILEMNQSMMMMIYKILNHSSLKQR